MMSAPALRPPAIGFAHRGARAHAREATIDAFKLGLRLGATGLACEAWSTADGHVVLHPDGQVGSRLRRRPVGGLARADLPEGVVTLEDLYAACGEGFDLFLDVRDPAVVGPVVERARAAGALERLWLGSGDRDLVASWRAPHPDVRLVDLTRLAHVREGAERRAARAAADGIDAVGLHRDDWSAGMTSLFHRFERLAFAWDVQLERHLAELLDAGVDAVSGDFADRIGDAIRAAYPA